VKVSVEEKNGIAHCRTMERNVRGAGECDEVVRKRRGGEEERNASLKLMATNRRTTGTRQVFGESGFLHVHPAAGDMFWTVLALLDLLGGMLRTGGITGARPEIGDWNAGRRVMA
jgi:hypothetical protein